MDPDPMNPWLEGLLSLVAWLVSLAAIAVFVLAFFEPYLGHANGMAWLCGSAPFAVLGAIWILCRATSNRGW